MPEDPLHDLHAWLTEATKDELLELVSFLIQALGELHAGLMEAKRSRDDGGADWARASAHQALQAVNRFLHVHSMEKASNLIVMLQSALLDLDHGITRPMLAAADGDRVSPHSAHFRGYAAGIMGGLIKHAHMSQPQAEAWVSKKLRASGYEVAALTVRDWRKDARNHKNRELYKDYRTIIDRPEWANAPLSYAEMLIVRLISVHP